MSLIAPYTMFGGGGGGYSQNVVDNGGAGYIDYAASEISNSGILEASLWFTPNSVTGDHTLLKGDSGPNGWFIINAAGKLSFGFRDTSATKVWTAATTSVVFSIATQYHVYLNIDLSGPTSSVLIDGSAPTLTTNTALNAGNGTLSLNQEGGVLAINGGTDLADVEAADFFLETGHTIHGYSAFHDTGSPKDISALGSPDILLTDVATAWDAATNEGSISLTSGATGFTDV